MTKEVERRRTALGRILLGTSAFTGVMSIVYIIKFVFFNDRQFMDIMVAIAFAATMLFGTLIGVVLNYTIRVPRGKDDDMSQVVAAMVMMGLGVIICTSLQVIIGVNADFVILPIVFYIQNAVMMIVAAISMQFYRK